MKMSLKLLVSGIVLLLVVLFGLGVAALVWANQQLAPVNPADNQAVLVVIPKGSSTAKTAQILSQKGLIRNEYVFRLYARSQGLEKILQAGSYEIAPTMTVAEIIHTFEQGSQAVWITLPEGLRVEEVAARFSALELAEFDQHAFIALAKPSEGRLFPDTYLIPRESTAEQLFALLTRTFRDKVEVNLAEQLQKSDRSLDEVIIIASLVQRESSSPADMRNVAGVINNRLHQGMKLDIDATLSYARGYDEQQTSWWSAPSPALKSSDSPYNTYLISGLPPAPIANPGLAAIQAALDPSPSSALFYLHSPTGQAYYADTLEQHNRNIERYLR